MSAETLRRATALMRRRAEAATPGPWVASEDHEGRETGDGYKIVGEPAPVDALGGGWVAAFVGKTWGWGPSEPNADHIASWHPAVALAVADLIDAIDDGANDTDVHGYVLAVARSYIGENA